MPNACSRPAGIGDMPGTQLRYANPQIMQQTLTIVLSAQEPEKQERCNESFYTRFDKSVRIIRQSPSRTSCERDSPSSSADKRASSRMRGQYRKPMHSPGNTFTVETIRNSQTKVALRCYKCQDMGHFTRECPTRQKGKLIPLTRREGKIPASVRSVHVPRSISPRLQANGKLDG